jgi:L-alanine-DL-glutamate epimerase-like enolase superfamily enzyme
MRITNVETRLLAVELPLEFEGGTYSINRRSAVLCRLTTDEGLTATVCVGNEDHYSDYFFALLRGAFKEIVVGQDPTRTEHLWAQMAAMATGYVDKAELTKAMSTLDIALWDLKARIAGMPLHRLLGGARERVPLIAIGGYYEVGDSYDRIAREVERLKDYGVAGVKWKVGKRELAVDAGRIGSVRKAAGSDFIIIADSNMAWTPQDALRFADLIEDHDISWLEEPVHWTQQFHGLRRLREQTSLPLAAGQSEVSVFSCGWLLSNRCVDVLNLCSNRGGGITGWLKLAGQAALEGVRMANVAEPHIAGHLMAAIGNGTFAECYADERRDPFWEQLYRDRPKIEDGMLVLPAAPGLGVELDDRAVERYAVSEWL